MITRRSFVIGGLALSVPYPVIGGGFSIVDIDEIAKAIGDAADAIGKLGDGIAHLITLGSQGWSAIQRHRVRASLIGIVRSAAVIHTFNEAMPQDISDYLSAWDDEQRKPPDQRSDLQLIWARSADSATGLLKRVNALTKQLEQDSSQFVFTDAYRELLTGLEKRKEILQNWPRDPPKEGSQITALRKVRIQYIRLIDALDETISKANAYASTLQ